MDYETYVAQRYQTLCRFAGVLSGNPSVAEEVVAEVLARAYEQWDRVGSADNPHAYVRRMVLNQYLRWRTVSARTSVVADVEELASPVPDQADDRADRDALARELLQLPARQRAALVLRYYEGMSTREIAEVLDTGEVTVRSNISRALQRLRIQLDEDADFPPPIARRAR